MVRARNDGDVKEEATAVLASMAMTVSEAFRLMLIRIAKEKKLPFEPLVPNEQTIEAMKQTRRGNVKSFQSVEALIDDLHGKD